LLEELVGRGEDRVEEEEAAEAFGGVVLEEEEKVVVDCWSDEDEALKEEGRVEGAEADVEEEEVASFLALPPLPAPSAVASSNVRLPSPNPPNPNPWTEPDSFALGVLISSPSSSQPIVVPPPPPPLTELNDNPVPLIPPP